MQYEYMTHLYYYYYFHLLLYIYGVIGVGFELIRMYNLNNFSLKTIDLMKIIS